jgi:hypothetical protein
MAYGGQFLKITWMFTVNGSDEVADTSLNYTSTPPWTGAAAALAELDSGDLVAMRDHYVDQMMDFDFISWGDYSNLVGIKVAAIGTNGLYLTDPLIAETDTPDSGNAVGVLPQASVVLSLRSGFTVGKGNYGRMYLPHTTIGTVTETPFASSTITDGCAAAGKAFINAVTATMNGAITAPVGPVIMSQAAGTLSRVVAQVAVGNVTDTQRRRRNRLNETYSFETL